MFQTFGIRKAFMALSLKGGSAIIGFLVSLLVVKLLTVEDSGGFFLSLAILYIANIVVQVGLDQTLTRYFSREQSITDEVVSVYVTSVLIIGCSSTLASAMLYFSSNWISLKIFGDSSLDKVLPIMCLTIVPYSLQWLHAHILLGLGKNNLFHVFQNVFVNTAFLIIIVLSQLLNSMSIGIDELACAFLLASIASSFFSTLECARLIIHKFPNKILTNMKGLLSISTPMYGSAILGIVSSWMSVILLGLYQNTSEVAVFTVAIRIASLVTLVLMAMNSLTFPKYAIHYSRKEFYKIREISFQATRITLSISVPLSIIIILFSEDIMALFGEEYGPHPNILRILIASQLVLICGGSAGGILGMTSHQKEMMYSGLIGVITMLFMNLVLTSNYGIYGAAVSHLLGVVTQIIFVCLAVRKRFGFFPPNVFIK